MKLLRPHIPLDVKLQVAARQLCQGNGLACVLSVMASRWTKQAKLDWMLHVLFGTGPVHLDHDPPLVLRPFNERTGKYKPDANDPRHLVYRTEEDHRIKTFVKGDGAQLSDAGKRRKEIKRARKAAGEHISRPLRSANRWPPKGSRPLGRR